MNRVWLIIFGDFIAFWVSLIIILFTRFGDNYQQALATHSVPFAILYLSWILIFFLFSLYNIFSIKPTIPHIRQFGLALIVSLFVGILFFYFMPMFGIAPKTNLFFQIIGFGLLSFVFRRFVYIYYSKQIVRPVILVGKTVYINELHKIIDNNPQLGLHIVSYTEDLHKSLENYINMKNSVFIFEGLSNQIPKKDIVTLYQNKTEIMDVAEAYERFLYKIPTGYISQSWIIENIDTQEDIGYDALTRMLNILFSISIIILSSPFWIISAILIWSYDRGPIFIKQKRVGLNGKIFNLHKMRSMVVLSPDGSAEMNKAIWSTGANDPRITPVGRIIRKLHIDELPQMINILKGELSFVGPRPERPEFVESLEEAIPHYELRHIIRPGFTGWAQIKYRYARTTEDSKEKFEYDLYYIKNRNIFLDFGIILRTIQIVFTH